MMRHRRRPTARPAVARPAGNRYGGASSSPYYMCVLFFIRAAMQFCIYEKSQFLEVVQGRPQHG